MAETTLDIQIEERQWVQVVTVTGPLDSVTYDLFREKMEPLVGTSSSRVVLDCTHLSYVNSRGLTLLARYQRLAAGTLSFFGIAALSERIMRAIELLGLAKLLTLYPTVDEAIKAASSM